MESVLLHQSTTDPLLSHECHMFLLEFSVLVADCTEYDLLPHVESRSHRSLVKCESSLGICTCTIDWCYRNLTRLHPTSYTDGMFLSLFISGRWLIGVVGYGLPNFQGCMITSKA
ncbi:hypothetical protein AHF37_06756 [Paragonimus kellicotti]|nr:hypothetical protein AHF37_06756 [Paragonimus kellicotti]